jgi:hypothetical protein
MTTYTIFYSTAAGGSIDIQATSKQEAIDIFDSMEFDDLFELKDLYRGVEIDDIEKC